jgi:hypothetical protein
MLVGDTVGVFGGISFVADSVSDGATVSVGWVGGIVDRQASSKRPAMKIANRVEISFGITRLYDRKPELQVWD